MFEGTTLVGDYMTLFRGRGDAFGTWEGGCKRAPVTEETFRNHLYGVELAGIYPVVPMKNEARCVWGCSDIDVDDLDAARNLQTAFMIKGITAWVEKTRKGYHVWVFSTKTVTAATMRRAFLAAHQAVDYPAKEVNPKQEQVGSGLGNYVRLPYPNGLGEDNTNSTNTNLAKYNDIHVRYMLTDDDTKMLVGTFVQTALDQRATPEQLEAIAALWVPPATQQVVYDGAVDADGQALATRVGALGYVVWRDGPKPGADRSLTLYRLCLYCREAELSPTEAAIVIKSADLRWGKFFMRPDPDKEIYRLVTKVYGNG